MGRATHRKEIVHLLRRTRGTGRGNFGAGYRPIPETAREHLIEAGIPYIRTHDLAQILPHLPPNRYRSPDLLEIIDGQDARAVAWENWQDLMAVLDLLNMTARRSPRTKHYDLDYHTAVAMAAAAELATWAWHRRKACERAGVLQQEEPLAPETDVEITEEDLA